MRPRLRLPRWLLLIGRVIVVLCAMQLTGTPHVVVGVVLGAEAGCIESCSRPCEDDHDSKDCPPGCPDCSCTHGRMPSLLPLAPALPEQLAWDLPETWTPYRSGEPPSPPLPHLYRPPRS